METYKKIALVGGGPAALFMYKQLIESAPAGLHITIYEKTKRLGAGMPYSAEGACAEHVTNVSGNEIPEIVTSVEDWLKTDSSKLQDKFNIHPDNYNDLKVMPRLLFGEYLSTQFELLRKKAGERDIITEVFFDTVVTDIHEKNSAIKISTHNGCVDVYDQVIICTGHYWSKTNEDSTPGWFDSPYPPSKLSFVTNHTVAIKGAGLTAIDAIRTLARQNGHFKETEDKMLQYVLHDQSAQFKLVLHSIEGLLPAIRFHLKDPHLSPGNTEWTEEEVGEVMVKNDGFVPLDYIFERNFKMPLRDNDTAFYEEIKQMRLEGFVDYIMSYRKNKNAFELFKEEYIQAEKSIKSHRSVYWKERLSILSYALNYPAKHLSAEDMIRLKKVLMPLISVVIAFVPQSSAKELLALFDAGVLSLLSVDTSSKVEPAKEGGASYLYTDDTGSGATVWYQTFVDGTGQKPIDFENFIFPGLKQNNTVSAASLRFKNEEAAKTALEEGNKEVYQSDVNQYYLKVPGVSINDHFQVLDKYGVANTRIYVMAVPFIAGLNPDYSGLDFCEKASFKIGEVIFKDLAVG